jgi:8-oxo-dGTP diphosphatase
MTDDRSNLRKKWKKEVSAGGIVFKKQDGRVFVLMILPRKRDMKDKHYTPAWTFPKGWVGDHGKETVEQTALREVREEGGVNGNIVTKLGVAKYFFNWEGENVAKLVHHFLIEYTDGSTDDHDNEVTESKWFDLEEAGKILTYKTDKEIFKKAEKELNKIG